MGLFYKKGGCLENIFFFLLIFIYLFDNFLFWVVNKINDVFYFGVGWYFCFNFCESIWSVEFVLINDVVGIVDIFYNFVWKIMMMEFDDVDFIVSDRFVFGYDIWRNIFIEMVFFLNYDVFVYLVKLVY